MAAVTRAKAYLKARHKAVHGALDALKLDALLLTHPGDLAWLTNFTGDDSIGVITRKDVHLVTDFRYVEQARLEAGWLKLTKREGKMADALAGALLPLKAARIGFEANFMTFGQVAALKKALKEQSKGKPVPELVPIEDVLVNLRKVKDDQEVPLIRQSVDVAQEAFNAVRDMIMPGETESHLAGLLILELRSRGASDVSFPPSVAAGAASALPHYRPGDVELKNNAPVLFDWGAVVGGYCSDLTRTFMLGRVPAKLKTIYNVVLEAQLAAIAFMRPGVLTTQCDRVARDVIEKAGFGEYFGHSLGHGIGRNIHEMPTMRKTGGEEELRPGMVVTVEPGIYLPGIGGVRIEDDVLITHSGCEVLSNLPKSYEDCHIE
jgi:Xaa-Pro aminopeptidase